VQRDVSAEPAPSPGVSLHKRPHDLSSLQVSSAQCYVCGARVVVGASVGLLARPARHDCCGLASASASWSEPCLVIASRGAAPPRATRLTFRQCILTAMPGDEKLIVPAQMGGLKPVTCVAGRVLPRPLGPRGRDVQGLAGRDRDMSMCRVSAG
jgi:hypothetical protein